jgi:hypothetical protein
MAIDLKSRDMAGLWALPRDQGAARNLRPSQPVVFATWCLLSSVTVGSIIYGSCSLLYQLAATLKGFHCE